MEREAETGNALDFEEQILDVEKVSVTVSVRFLGVKMKVFKGNREWLN